MPRARTADGPAGIEQLKDIEPFGQMFFLVNKFHTEQRQAFPVEMVLAICWEETQFQNKAALSGDPAVGYGLLERGGRRIANQHLTGNPDADEGGFSSETILKRRDISIQAVSHCLAGLFERFNRSIDCALLAYAGATERPTNAAKPRLWKKCAVALKKDLAGHSRGQAVVPNPLVVENALRQTLDFPDRGPVYDHIHSRLWPLLQLANDLKEELQLGSEGPQVGIVQDAMNRLRTCDPRSGDSLPPLLVDGQFGPQTFARVRQFQARNDLIVDGVVGPETRAALVKRAQLFPNA